jgi:hypothetical protein
MTFVEAVEEIVEVAAGVAPIDRSGSLLPGSLEGSDTRGELVEVVEVPRGQCFALQDREVDLDLIEPGGMYGQVHQDEVRPRGLEPLNTGFAGVAGAVVHDPEHALGRGVGLGGYDLLNEPAERLDPGLLLTATEQSALGVMYVERGEVGKGAMALILELVEATASRAGRATGSCRPSRAWSWLFSSAEMT